MWVSPFKYTVCYSENILCLYLNRILQPIPPLTVVSYAPTKRPSWPDQPGKMLVAHVLALQSVWIAACVGGHRCRYRWNIGRTTGCVNAMALTPALACQEFRPSLHCLLRMPAADRRGLERLAIGFWRRSGLNPGPISAARSRAGFSDQAWTLRRPRCVSCGYGKDLAVCCVSGQPRIMCVMGRLGCHMFLLFHYVFINPAPRMMRMSAPTTVWGEGRIYSPPPLPVTPSSDVRR